MRLDQQHQNETESGQAWCQEKAESDQQERWEKQSPSSRTMEKRIKASASKHKPEKHQKSNRKSPEQHQKSTRKKKKKKKKKNTTGPKLAPGVSEKSIRWSNFLTQECSCMKQRRKKHKLAKTLTRNGTRKAQEKSTN